MRLPFTIIGIPIGLAVGWFGSALVQCRMNEDSAVKEGHSLNLTRRAARQTPWVDSLPSEARATERILAMAYAAPATPSEFARRLHELQTVERGTFVQDALNQLMDEWVSHDPEGAFAAGLAIKGTPGFQASALLAATMAWASVDMDAALGRVKALPTNLRSRDPLLTRLGELIGKDSPEHAIALLNSENLVATSEFQRFYESLARKDLGAAVEELEDSDSSFAYSGVLSVWLERDSQAALSHLNASSLLRFEKRKVLAGLIPSLMADNPVAAVELLSGILPKGEFEAARIELVEQWVAQDPDAAMRWAEEQGDDGLRGNAARLIGDQLVRARPAEAFEYFVDQGLPNHLRGVAYEWGKTDWKDAFSRIQSMTDDAFAHAHAAAGLLISEAPSMKMDEIRQILSITESHGQRMDVRPLLDRLGVEEISSLLDSYPVSLGATVRHFVADLAEFDPRGALMLASKLRVEGADLSIAEAVVKWAGNDPEGPKEWLAMLPPGETRTDGYRNYMNALSRSDPEAARAALSTIPEDVRLEATRQFVEVTESFDRETALTEALGTGDESLISEFMERWHWVEPERARARAMTFDSVLRKSVEDRIAVNELVR